MPFPEPPEITQSYLARKAADFDDWVKFAAVTADS
jgi:hypothetical protein